MGKLGLLDLYSGIGGFSLGLERTGGFETRAFCEKKEFPRRVLAKCWPGVPCYGDVSELTASRLAADGISVDAICGGFPCQDISISNHVWGAGLGLDGSRSGQWSHFHRLVGEIRPRVVIVENVANLLSGPRERPGEWFGRLLGQLAKIGYDAEWHCIPAAAIGAPHERDRVFIVAHPHGIGPQGGGFIGKSLKEATEKFARRSITGGVGREVPCGGAWENEPSMGRVVDGVPNRSHRLASLGNAVVPQIVEIIGHAILANLQTERAVA